LDRRVDSTAEAVTSFILRRVLLSIPTLFGVLVAAFMLLYIAPGDPVEAMIGERADSATITRLRAQLHLDDPLPQRFGHYVASVVTGDLGRSYITNRPISQDIRERFPKTMQLAGAAMLIATFFGVTLGVLSARNPGGIADRLSLGISYLGISFPVYWVGLLLILLFAVTLRWLPPSGYGGLRFLILPAVTLGMRSIAFQARMTRSAMLDALAADYTRTARAKGLSESLVTLKHALRNALIPVITVLGLDFGSYLTGSILTETIFSWPGIGRYVVNAITRRDLPAIQGTVLFLSTIFVLVNLITDLAYAKADPRVSYS
jgi:ABC-type dipeptide/oligopeptide/nickel transport system permease component